jgi:general secretion pathway protein F
VPVYAYKGVNQAGRPTRGTVTADGPRSARSKMRASGVFLTELAEAEGDAALVSAAKPGA